MAAAGVCDYLIIGGGTCKSGFHFCQQPSGVWAYYSADTTRIFEIEAYDILDTPFESGTDYKRVCRKIKFSKEITPERKSNLNTGDGNIGNMNTGIRNTGNWNTGNWNTGYGNTGNGNTGNGNAGNYHSGYFNIGDADFIVFGKKADRKDFDFSLANELCYPLSKDEDFDAKEFLALPNATEKKIKALHREHIRLRANKKKEDEC